MGIKEIKLVNIHNFCLWKWKF